MKLSELKCPKCEGKMALEKVDHCLYARCVLCNMGFLLDDEADSLPLLPGTELSEAACKRYEAEKQGVENRAEIREWKKRAEETKKKQDEAHQKRAEFLEEYEAELHNDSRPRKEAQSTVLMVGGFVLFFLLLAGCCVGAMYAEEIAEVIENYYSDLYHLFFS